MAKHWIQGRRDDMYLGLVGGLLRDSKNWDVKRVQKLIELISIASDEELKDRDNRVGKVENTLQKLQEKKKVSGWPTLAKFVGEEVVAAFKEDLGIEEVAPLNIEIKKLKDYETIPNTFLWPPYFPDGELVMISGDPGLGKGWLSAKIAVEVASGGGQRSISSPCVGFELA